MEYQLRSNNGRLEFHETFKAAHARFEEQFVDCEDGGDNPEFWTKLSFSVAEGDGDTARLVLYDDGTYCVLSPESLAAEPD